MPILINASGNCNFAYVTGLRHSEKSEDAMAEVLTQKQIASYNVFAPKATKEVEPVYYAPSQGMYLFAQGSDDPVDKNPYAPNFKRYIEEQALGTVHEMPPVPNKMHGNKPGILFVWIINHDSCRKWWKKHVYDAWQTKQKASKITAVEKAAKKEVEKPV